MLRKFRNYNFMFEQLVKRDFIVKYKRTVLGMLWSIISPLLFLAIQIFVFKRFFGGGIEHYVIFLFSGNLVYNYYTEATKGALTALVGNAAIFSKVNVPKYLFVFSKNVTALINFGITFVAFLIFVAADGIPFTWSFLWLFYAIMCMFVCFCGMGLILSALYVFFRDMLYLYDILVLMLMYLSAIFYSVESFSPILQRLFLCNPLYVYIKFFRIIVINASIPSIQYFLLMLLDSLLFLGLGSLIYKKYNHEFLYYI